MPEYIAFYWTFSVKRAGFKSLSVYEVDAAAANSKTIRYQRDRIRAEFPGRRLHEVAYIEQSDDRPTGGAERQLIEAVEHFGLKDTPTIVLVDFTKIEGWRPQKALFQFIKKHWKLFPPLKPEAIVIDVHAPDGRLEPVLFRPAEHFKQSRERIERDRALVDVELIKAAKAVPPGRGRYNAIAQILADRKVRTQHGREWTGDNVRKRLSYLEAQHSQPSGGDPPQKGGG